MLNQLRRFNNLSHLAHNVCQNCSTKFITINFSSTASKHQNKSEHSAQDQKQQQKKTWKSSVPALRNPFNSASNKTRETYLDMITIFEEQSVHRRNHVEFIYAALRSMADFGVEHDLDVYKALINVMPKGKFIPTNMFQAEFMHYPKQQQCIIDLLEQMEDLGVMPDFEMEPMLLNVFGRRGHPLRKYWRMMYWMPKFKNLSPWPLPNPVPDDTLEMAKLAMERMCSIDLRSVVTVFETKDLPDALDHTWIVSGMSTEQAKLLREHSTNKSLYIEGPFLIWLRNRSLNYFTLRADPDAEFLKNFQLPADNDEDDVSQLNVPVFGRPTKRPKHGSIGKVRSVHQQDDGTIFSICATGTSSKDSLLSWIRLLETNNPVLGSIPIVFRFKSTVDANNISIEAAIDTDSSRITNDSCEGESKQV